MPLTRIDPNTALIVIDLQKGLRGLLPAETFDPVITQSRALADAFRARSLPVVLVTANGVAPGRTEDAVRVHDLPPGFADVVDELDPQTGDLRVTKQTWGAFASTNIGEQLKALGVTQVVITGVATSAEVESTARQAYEAGLNVTLAIDAMAERHDEMHDHSIAWIFPRLGETGKTAEVLALLARGGRASS